MMIMTFIFVVVIVIYLDIDFCTIREVIRFSLHLRHSFNKL